ncbi:MAG: serine/threonine-protein kinase, partial [Planctomycetota bacterium]|jgi:tetratricopeptide (TPR) repeat protein
VVYEGAQQSPQRAVAIKVVRMEMISPRMLSRFRNEAEILGRLDHPGIARIYEADTARMNGGVERPFFAMELVRGRPLLDHARDLDTAARLRLFADVCDAVHHAHQKGVIHRDLKPANILVTDEGESEGQVKVLDFGIARATDADIQAVTVQTDMGQLLGTVPYMSPEQLEGNLGRLDTRSDVYALAVVLFELLTGALPHDVREQSFVSAARIIRDEEPTRLSTVIPALRGDLEWIVAKALEKDVDRRYDSASALAADIRRHLADEPVSAGPPTASYRLQKFVRRNRVGVGWAALAALLVVTGITATVGQAIRATRAEGVATQARDDAIMESERARAIAEYLKWSFGFADPYVAAERSVTGDLTVAELLDLSLEDLDERFAGRPLAIAEVLSAIASAYSTMGNYGEARVQSERAVALFEAQLGPNHPRVYWAKWFLSHMLREDGDPAGSDRVSFETLAMAQRAIAEASPELGAASTELEASVLALGSGRVDPAEAAVGAKLAAVRRAFEAVDEPTDDLAMFVTMTLYTGAGYMGNRLGPGDDNYRMSRAAVEIGGLIDWQELEGYYASVCWLHARRLAPPGAEDERVQVARRHVELRTRAMPKPNHFSYDAAGILGDALLQRQRPEDREEAIGLILEAAEGIATHGRRQAEGGHRFLSIRNGQTIVRLAGGSTTDLHDPEAVRWLDRPDVIEVLRDNLDLIIPPEWMNFAAWSMVRRAGFSNAWYAVGLALARAAVERAPERADFARTLGVAEFRIGNHTAALAHLERPDADPSTVDLAFAAVCHHRLGDETRARSVLDAARAVLTTPDGQPDEDAVAALEEAEATVTGAAAPVGSR